MSFEGLNQLSKKGLFLLKLIKHIATGVWLAKCCNITTMLQECGYYRYFSCTQYYGKVQCHL